MKALSAIPTAVLTLVLIGCTHGGVRPVAPPAQKFAIIDAHTHTDFDGKPETTSGIPFTLERYLEERKQAGVVGAVSHNAKEGVGQADLRSHSVIHCGAVMDRISSQSLERDLKSRRLGCLKIYLGYIHHYAYDPIYEPAYRLAEKYDVPVVFHTGDTYSTKALLKYADPLTIDEVAVKHPRVKFLIAHMGNPWIQSAAEVAYKNPNVYIEASGVLIGDLKRFSPEYIDRYFVAPLKWVHGYLENPDKILFGTDWPLVGMSEYIEAYKLAIPPEDWEKVFYLNAKKLFRF
jgi:uncharacterized protein